MAGHTTVRDRGWNRIMRELQVAKVTEVVIGIQQGSQNSDGVDIAEYAAANEFGTSRIPERSFMRSTFDENVQEIKREMDSTYGNVLAGSMTIRGALATLGMKHQTDVQLKINSNIQPANSPYTIAQKGSSRTLIDTAAMRNSVKYIIRAVR